MRPRAYPDAVRWLVCNALTALGLFLLLVALVSASGCVNGEAMRQLQVVAAADEGDMADSALGDDARRIAMENAYAIHQALWLLDSDHKRPAWVEQVHEAATSE